jgi:hypothetical protein
MRLRLMTIRDNHMVWNHAAEVSDTDVGGRQKTDLEEGLDLVRREIGEVVAESIAGDLSWG